MTDLHRVLDVIEFPGTGHVEIDFMDMAYDGPRAVTIKLSNNDALFLLDALAAAFNEVPVPEGSIVFERESTPHLYLVKSEDFEPLPRCDGYCADCNHTCPNRAWPLNTEDPRDNSARWCLWANEPLPLGHSHPHQVEGA